MKMHAGQGRLAVAALSTVVAWATFLAPAWAQRAAPVIVVETTQGAFAIETYPQEAPASVAHVVSLARSGFYNGQRIHRVVPALLVQFGDPQTRDLEKRDVWGLGAAASSGKPVGVTELSTKHPNVAMSVGLAHLGEPATADSQLYILLNTRPELDGQYVVIGRLIEGTDVLPRLKVGDQINRVFVRE